MTMTILLAAIIAAALAIVWPALVMASAAAVWQAAYVPDAGEQRRHSDHLTR